MKKKSENILKFQLPQIPDELKHAKTPREKEYLDLLQQCLVKMKQDYMTGLESKEYFESSEKSEGVYIFIDGDGLKQINDTYGHSAGSAAIHALAEAIKKSLRSERDVTQVVQNPRAARFGGDEFLVFIEGVSLSIGIMIAKRILNSIHNQKIQYSGENLEAKQQLENMSLKASIGVGKTIEQADQAMYKAKEGGRDRVEFSAKTKAAECLKIIKQARKLVKIFKN